MLYKIEKDKTVFESNPGIELNQFFAECSDRELKYIFLTYDIEGPYIKMRFDDRQVKAALQAGYRREKGGKRFDRNARPVLAGNVPRVNASIREFKQIQLSSNTNYTVLEVIRQQLDRTTKFIEDAKGEELKVKEMLDLNKLAKDLEGLVQTRVNIERILNIDEAELGDDKDEDVRTNLSMLDQENLDD